MASPQIELKRRHAQRAFDTMEAYRANLDQDGFEFYFGALLGAVGAIRQYVQSETGGYTQQNAGPRRAWWLKLENVNDFATIVGLRNSDVHDATVVPHRRAVQMYGHAVVTTSGQLGVVIHHADGTLETRTFSPGPTQQPAQSTPPVTTVDYFIDPIILQNQQPPFMPPPNDSKKGDVLNHLTSKSLSAIAQDCLATLDHLIEEAENHGYIRRS